MTLDQQIAHARRALEFAQAFRAGIEELTEGEAKPAMLAQADATIAKIGAALRDLVALAAMGTETLQ